MLNIYSKISLAVLLVPSISYSSEGGHGDEHHEHGENKIEKSK